MPHRESHRSGRAGWLRAAVLGADDGIVSTASLVIGVAAAAASRNAAQAATVAGRLMAADPLGSHVRDELGLQTGRLARPLQAAVVSAVSFALGGGPGDGPDGPDRAAGGRDRPMRGGGVRPPLSHLSRAGRDLRP